MKLKRFLLSYLAVLVCIFDTELGLRLMDESLEEPYPARHARA